MKKILTLLLSNIERLLRYKEFRNYSEKDFDSKEVLQKQKQIFFKKKILHYLYDIYSLPILESLNNCNEKAICLKIGSGNSYLTNKIPNLIKSDIIFSRDLNIVFSAEYIPFKNNSIDNVFLMFVFHHIGNVEKLLTEIVRILKVSGECIIVDPAITIWSKIYYKYFHPDRLDISAADWSFKVKGRMSSSNIALAWIVFFRDKEKFLLKFPQLKIDKICYNTCISFLLSGGLRYKKLLPGFFIKIIFNIENWIIRNVSNQISVTMSVKLKRIIE